MKPVKGRDLRRRPHPAEKLARRTDQIVVIKPGRHAVPATQSDLAKKFSLRFLFDKQASSSGKKTNLTESLIDDRGE